MTEFEKFPKIPRLSRECVVTEKIDGTNAQICITAEDEFLVGSRKRWITPGDDNFGFAKWAHEHEEELRTLGPGHHFGEWWGSGIQRKYGLTDGERRFSLFNTVRWCLHGDTPKVTVRPDPKVEDYIQDILPPCCGLVPILYQGPFTTPQCDFQLAKLTETGSRAAPGFMNPEGIVVFHTAANKAFKKTIEKDEIPKGKANGKVI
jgi:hypothetical protein